jgi:hypothetical protein
LVTPTILPLSWLRALSFIVFSFTAVVARSILSDIALTSRNKRSTGGS